MYDDIQNGLVSLDGGNVVLDFVDPDGSGGQSITLSKRYLYGEVVDQILAQEDVTKNLAATDRVLWPLVDNLGTVRDLAKQDGTIAVHYKYDSYGNVTSGDTSKTRYLFTSREFDTATNLQYNRARWFDAEVGRWISEDPLGFEAGDANVARYVRNQVTRVLDPSGLADNPIDLHGDETAPHIEWKTGQWFTWVPFISHLNNQGPKNRFKDWLRGAPLDSYIKSLLPDHPNIVSNLYSGGNFCCNGISGGIGGGGVWAYVINLPPGNYNVTYWYHVTLRANGQSKAGAMITEDSKTAMQISVNGANPVATFDSMLQTRIVPVTVGSDGKAIIFKYEPGATTGHGAGVHDNATARGEFGIIRIEER